MIFEDRKTLLIILCMLEKSGVAAQVRDDDADDEDEDDEIVEDGRLARTA